MESITHATITTYPADHSKSIRPQPMVSPRRWVSLVMRAMR